MITAQEFERLWFVASVLGFWLAWRVAQLVVTDIFKHRLFGLRRELFALRAAGQIPKNSEYSRHLCDLISRSIYFASELYLLRIFCFVRSEPRLPKEYLAQKVKAHQDLMRQPEHVAAHFKRVEEQHQIALIVYMIARSPLVFLASVVYFIVKHNFFSEPEYRRVVAKNAEADLESREFAPGMAVAA